MPSKRKTVITVDNTQALELLVDDVYVVDGESYRAAGGDGPLRITAAGPISFLAPVGRKGETITMAEPASAVDQHVPDDLEAEMASLSSKTVSPDFLVFVEALKARFESSLDAVLLYGSCLRAHEIGEGVADFYVVVDSYDKAYPERYLSQINAWLPPNVFYLEVSRQEQKFRAKYAVVSMADFERGTRQWFHPYLWARFAQPSRLLYARDEVHRQAYSPCARLCCNHISGINSSSAGLGRSERRSDLDQRLEPDLCGGVAA